MENMVTNLIGKSVTVDPAHAISSLKEKRGKETGEIALVEFDEGACTFGVLWEDGKLSFHLSDFFIVETDTMRTHARIKRLSAESLEEDARKAWERLSTGDKAFLHRTIGETYPEWPSAVQEPHLVNVANILSDLKLIRCGDGGNIIVTKLGYAVGVMIANEDLPRW